MYWGFPLNRDTEAKIAITEVIYRTVGRSIAWTGISPTPSGIRTARPTTAPTFHGPAGELLDVMWVNHAALAGHLHQVTNILIDVDGDSAGSEAYVTGFLWNESDAGIVSHMVAIGRYLDRWSRREGRGRSIIAGSSTTLSFRPTVRTDRSSAGSRPSAPLGRRQPDETRAIRRTKSWAG